MAGDTETGKKGGKWFVILIYFIFGVYFVNYHFKFLKIPEFISQFDSWIIFFGGLLLFLGAINYFRLQRNKE